MINVVYKNKKKIKQKQKKYTTNTSHPPFFINYKIDL